MREDDVALLYSLLVEDVQGAHQHLAEDADRKDGLREHRKGDSVQEEEEADIPRRLQQ